MKLWQTLIRRFVVAGSILALAGAGSMIRAQEPAAPVAQPAADQNFRPQQLDDLVAPIALYSDPLLSQVLVASTYPLEVVEAQQWLEQHRSLRGSALMDAARRQPWDASVQALVAFPDVLANMNQDIRWTRDLGNGAASTTG